MLVGGIDGHRSDLSSMVMLKDNHIWSSGSITKAIQQTRSVSGFSLLIDVEVQTEQEADEAIEAGADIIMLDNMESQELLDVAKRLKERWVGKRRFLLETSGGIEEYNLRSRAMDRKSDMPKTLFSDKTSGPAIDIVSTSAVHQSVQHIDFSLKIQIPKRTQS